MAKKVDPTRSSRIIDEYTEDDYLAEKLEFNKLEAQIEHLETIAEHLEKNEDYQTVVKKSYDRLNEIAHNQMKLNRCDPHFYIKDAVALGQYNERFLLTQELIGVNNHLQEQRERRTSWLARLAEKAKRLTE
jgi:hypothetical protein